MMESKRERVSPCQVYQAMTRDIATMMPKPANCWLVAIIAVGLMSLSLAHAGEKDKKPRYPKAPSAENVPLVPAAWQTAPRKPLSSADLDHLLTEAQQKDKVTPAQALTDEEFLRRATLDLTGKLPSPAQIEEFVNSSDRAKRTQLIDRLLDSDDFSTNWARYWRDVLLWRATDMRVITRLPRTYGLEVWLDQQLKAKRSWGAITRDLLRAEGMLEIRAPTRNGAIAFILAHAGDAAAVERASDTARVFLGIKIQCAQCHDHPNDIWKRNQFHELAAFFGRLTDKEEAAERGSGIRLIANPTGEYQMPDRDNPKKTWSVHPRFLTGEAVPQGLSDHDRRKQLADLITSPDNYWFAAAFVNRIWGALMGQAFYQPVDNMGPLQEATYPNVLLRLADSFRATNHDIRGMFRTIMNSQAYQRQFRLGDNTADHLHFAAAYPSRLRGDAIWWALERILGPFPGEQQGAKVFAGGAGIEVSPFAKNKPSLQFVVKKQFDYDPSIKSDELEGSITQAMMLMNSQVLNDRIRARGDTPLARVLSEHQQDDSAVQIVYLQTLCRKPTARELKTCLDYIKEVGKRGEALEDILWTLVNSTEFQTKR
jgi:hypothetical protein